MGRKKQAQRTAAMPVLPPWLTEHLQSAMQKMSGMRFPKAWFDEKIMPLLDQAMDQYGEVMPAVMATAQRVMSPDFMSNLMDAATIEKYYQQAYAPLVQQQLKEQKKELAGKWAAEGKRGAAGYLEQLGRLGGDLRTKFRTQAAQQVPELGLKAGQLAGQTALGLPGAMSQGLQGVGLMAQLGTAPYQAKMERLKTLLAGGQTVGSLMAGQVGKTYGKEAGMFGIGGI